MAPKHPAVRAGPWLQAVCGPQYVPHLGEGRPVGSVQWPWVTVAALRGGWKERSLALPQVIRNKIGTGPDAEPNKIVRPMAQLIPEDREIGCR